MTDADLRDLFQAAAPDLERPDPAAVDRAWRDGCRRRVGSRAGAPRPVVEGALRCRHDPLIGMRIAADIRAFPHEEPATATFAREPGPPDVVPQGIPNRHALRDHR